jgi:chorismate dehydratase
MRRLRISAISYLNTAPLMWDFEHGHLGQHFDVSYTVPSLCAQAVAEGTADIGIIPAIAYQTIPDLVIIPDIAIAARGPVRSILLVSKVPAEKIKTVAVDTSSRTSVVLLQILFRNGWLDQSHPERSEGAWRPAKSSSPQPLLVPMQPQLDQMLASSDAALLIGDPALTVDRAKYHTVDLAEAWFRATGKPFVFAFWAVRRAAIAEYPDPARLSALFQQSRNHGLAHINDIAREWAARVGISEGDVRDYLSRNIDFTFGESNQAGLDLFFQLAREFGLIPQIRPLEFTTAAVPQAQAQVR